MYEMFKKDFSGRLNRQTMIVSLIKNIAVFVLLFAVINGYVDTHTKYEVDELISGQFAAFAKMCFFIFLTGAIYAVEKGLSKSFFIKLSLIVWVIFLASLWLIKDVLTPWNAIFIPLLLLKYRVISLWVRRMHDFNYHGYVLSLVLLFYTSFQIIPVMLFIFKVNALYFNSFLIAYGRILLNALALIMVLALFCLGVIFLKKGSEGENRFGLQST